MAGPISIAILGDSRDLVRSLDTAESKMGRLGKAGGIMGKAVAGGLLATAAGGAAAGAFLVSAVGDASDLGEAASKVGVVFGKQADQIVKTSETAATSMGLTKSAYLQATGSLGNLLVSLDLAPKKAAGMSQEMVKLAGDLASFNNVAPEDALAALQSGLTGETEPLKKFGINMNDATLKAQAMKMGLIKSTKEALDPQTKALSAQALIMKQSGTAQGDFARTSGGLANQQRILSAQFGDVKATIGTALLPIFTKVVTFVNTNVIPAFAGLGGSGSTIMTFLAPALAMVQLGIAALVPVLTVAAGFVTGQLVPAVLALAGYLQTTLGPIFTSIVGIIQTQVIPIVQSLAIFFYGTLYPAVLKIVTSVATKLRPVFDQLATSFRTKILPAVSALLVKFKEWQPTIQRVVMIVVKVAGAVLGFAATLLAKVLPVAIRFQTFMVVTMWGAISKVIGIVVKIIAKIIDFGAALGRGVVKVNDFAAKINQKVADVVTYFVSLPGKVLDAIGDVGKTLYNAGASIIQGLIDGIESKIQVVKDKLGALTDLIPKLKGPAPRDARLLEPAGRLIMAGLLDGLDVGERLLVTKLGDLTDLIGGTRLGSLTAELAVTTSTRARPSLDAAYATALAARAATSRPQEIRVTLTAEQVHQLERGRALALDLKAYTRAGGSLA